MLDVTEREVAEFELTVALHALVDEAIQQRAAVVTEGGAPVAVDLKLVLCSGILQKLKKKKGKFSPSVNWSKHICMMCSSKIPSRSQPFNPFV